MGKSTESTALVFCFGECHSGDLLRKWKSANQPWLHAEAWPNLLQAIAAPAGAGRVASALTCLQVLPTHKGHHYYQLVKHYCSKRNGSALSRIQLVLAQDTRWQTFQQVPLAPW